MEISKTTPRETAIEAGRHDCRGCIKCCQYGSGYLVEEDLPRIAKFLGITEDKLKADFLEQSDKFNTFLYRPKSNKQGKPYGPCVFLTEKGCRIHDVKPLNCATGNCGEHSGDLQKWFDVNHFLKADDPESVRQYSLYLEFNLPLKGASLPEIVPDKEKLGKILSYEIIGGKK